MAASFHSFTYEIEMITELKTRQYTKCYTHNQDAHFKKMHKKQNKRV